MAAPVKQEAAQYSNVVKQEAPYYGVKQEAPYYSTGVAAQPQANQYGMYQPQAAAAVDPTSMYGAYNAAAAAGGATTGYGQYGAAAQPAAAAQYGQYGQAAAPAAQQYGAPQQYGQLAGGQQNVYGSYTGQVRWKFFVCLFFISGYG